MIPAAIFHAMHPLVNPRTQKLLAAQDFVNGEVVGKAYYLFTHSKFWETYQGSVPLSSDYVFSLVTGSSAFAIDSSTGIITILDITEFTATVTITVRCTFQDTYFEDQSIEIIYIPTASAVYLDPAFDGTSTGTRAAPYIRARNYPSGDRYGKTFFYKSGTTTLDEYLTMVNDPADPWTNFGRWGTGAKPIIDLSTNVEANRFMNFGSSSVSTDNGYNVRVCELSFYHDCSTNIFPFRIRGQSGAIEIYNCRFEGTTQRQGFIWCVGDGTTVAKSTKDRIFSNLELYDFREQIVLGVPDGCRAIKFERGGNIAENLIATTTFTGLTSAPISAVDQPYTDIRWAYMDTSTATNNRGPNIRTAFQTYENCYIIGPNEPIAITNKDQGSTFETNFPADGTSYFRYCIVEDGATAGISFFNAENLAEPVTATTVGIHGIIAINCANAINFGNGVRNVDVTSCLFVGSTAAGVRQTNGTGNRLINCTVVDSAGVAVQVSAGSLDAINCIIPTESGTLVKTTCSTDITTFVNAAGGNYRLAAGSALIGAGTYQAGLDDLDGVEFLNYASIGAYEYIAPTYTFTLSVFPLAFGTIEKDPVGAQVAGTSYTLTATPAAGKQFTRYAFLNGASWDLFSGINPLTATMPAADADIRAEFEDIPSGETFFIVRKKIMV